ncbi:MAG: tail fiber domain-containing protein, partial [Bacteroidota bacterium]
DGGSGTGTLNIRSGNGTGGAILASQAITIAPGTAGTEYEYMLTTPPSLTAGTFYTFELTGPICGYGWRYNSTSVYAAGSMFLSGAAQSGDLYFKTKMTNTSTQWVSLSSGAGSAGLTSGTAVGNTPYWDGTSWNAASSNIYNNGTNVGIGTNIPSTKFNVRYDLTGSNLWMSSFENLANINTSVNNGISIKAGHSSYAGNQSWYAVFITPSGAYVGSIAQTSSNSVSYNTTSDERLKTNITPSKYGLNELKQIDVKDYYYKNDDKTPQSGFIAQQLYQHYPFAVSPGGDDAQTRPWMVDYGKMTPLLVKSIQEQQEQIEALKAEIEKLKANK